MARGTRWIVRQPGADSVEEFLDRHGPGGVLYSQPSVPVCGSTELTHDRVISHLLERAEDLEIECARLRAEADAIARDLTDRSAGNS